MMTGAKPIADAIRADSRPLAYYIGNNGMLLIELQKEYAATTKSLRDLTLLPTKESSALARKVNPLMQTIGDEIRVLNNIFGVGGELRLGGDKDVCFKALGEALTGVLNACNSNGPLSRSDFAKKVKREIGELQAVAKAYAPQELRGCLENIAQPHGEAEIQRVDEYLIGNFGLKFEALQALAKS